MDNICGVYWIRNIENDKIYIGSSNDIDRRWYEHKNKLGLGKHGNQYLQRSYNKYGLSAFEFEVLITCHADNLIFYEQQFIDEWKPGYNIHKVAGSPLGFTHSEETKQKIGDAQKGTKHSEETKQKISEANKGHTHSDETKQKISETKKGKKHSDEHKQKNKETSEGHTYSAKLYQVNLLSPDGELITKIYNASKFARDNGLTRSSVHRLLSGEQKAHKGWTIQTLVE